MDPLDEHRWNAVRHRDAAFDGVFVYGVTTTRVACRPGCAARTPRRENVEYFTTLDDAQVAGYRACRRCRPEVEHPRDASLEAIITLCRRLELDDRVDVATLARDVGYSERHLRRRFRDVVGVPVSTYVRAARVERARRFLPSSGTVTAAVYAAGFGSSRAFYEHAANTLGMSPQRFRAGGDAERITFTTLATPLGHVIAATTARGVCAVRLGASEAALEGELAQEFPRSRLLRDDEGLRELATILALVVRGEGATTALPLDVQGTAFQVRVWEALRQVPRGTTLTYGQLAAAVGAPRSARAIGSACGANPVALIVPCHRIVRSDGSLGGYRWGVDVKATLLDAEADAAP